MWNVLEVVIVFQSYIGSRQLFSSNISGTFEILKHSTWINRDEGHLHFQPIWKIVVTDALNGSINKFSTVNNEQAQEVELAYFHCVARASFLVRFTLSISCSLNTTWEILKREISLFISEKLVSINILKLHIQDWIKCGPLFR